MLLQVVSNPRHQLTVCSLSPPETRSEPVHEGDPAGVGGAQGRGGMTPPRRGSPAQGGASSRPRPQRRAKHRQSKWRYREQGRCSSCPGFRQASSAFITLLTLISPFGRAAGRQRRKCRAIVETIRRYLQDLLLHSLFLLRCRVCSSFDTIRNVSNEKRFCRGAFFAVPAFVAIRDLFDTVCTCIRSIRCRRIGCRIASK